ncbi:MAG: hydrogenase maturation protease [Actinomycetota bacterium]
MRFFIAGVGNTLRADDGFGVRVAQRLQEQPMPDAVTVMDVGIGGIHMVQELLREPVDHLVVVDAVDLGRAPGTVLVIKPDVQDLSKLSDWERREELADMHYATPERAFMLARALEVLPRAVWVVGCQPREVDWLGERLSPEVEAAVPTAVSEILAIAREAGIDWPRTSRGGA